MNPLTLSIAVILVKYALDKGLELGKEVGPQALAAATQMFKRVLERIGKKRPETAAQCPDDPETYEKPLLAALEAELAADEAFAAELRALLARYEGAAAQHAAPAGVSYQAEVHGSGAAAQGEGAAAAGKGGTAVSGDVHGDIRIEHRSREGR